MLKKCKKIVVSALAVTALVVSVGFPTGNAISSSSFWRSGNWANNTLQASNNNHLIIEMDFLNRTTGALVLRTSASHTSTRRLDFDVDQFFTNRLFGRHTLIELLASGFRIL